MLAHESDSAKAGLADRPEFEIGVDTHLDWHAVVILRYATGEVVSQTRFSTTPVGYQRALAWAEQHAPGRREWAIEGTGSYGAGMTRFLAGQGEQVMEAPRPSRSDRRDGKSDELDAIRAARSVIAGHSLARPRANGTREALRLLVSTREGAVTSCTAAINELHSAITTCPEPLRSQLRHLTRGQLVTRCAQLRARKSVEPGITLALTSLAKRIQTLQAEEHQLKHEIEKHINTLAPQLLQEHGIGPICAAHILLAWSHKGRIPTEAAFAKLAGVAPIPASSGHTTRHRLNRGGDRKLNRALHMIVTTRLRDDATKEYIHRRTSQGKTPREAKRCLKRYIARHLYRLLEHTPQPT